MVGITTWRAGEVVWILKEWRTGRNLDELVENFRLQFPHVERRSFHKSITYVWQKYSKDPSYNHNFMSAEIAVIMEQQFVHRIDLERLVEKFQEDFPQHDWKQHVDMRTAINCVIGKFEWDHSTRCVPWEIDETRFILRNRLKQKSWDRLFEEFQTWTKHRDLTVESLQYLCVTCGFYRLDTKEGLENHYRASLSNPDEEKFTGSEVFNEASDSKMTHQNPTGLPLVEADSRTKIKRKFDSEAKEIQVKRVRYLPPQLWSHKKDQEIATEARNTSPSTYRNVTCNISSLVVPRESLGSLTESSGKPHFQLTGARVQNTERIKAVLSNNREHTPIPESKTSAVQVHPLQASKSQYSNARHHLSGITPQDNFNHGSGGQYHLMPPYIGELGVEQSHPDQTLISPSYLAHVPQNSLIESPPRITPTTNISKHYNDHIRHVSQYTETNSPLCWQERQLEYTDGCLARPTKRSRDQYDAKIENRPIQNDFIAVGHPYSYMGVEGKIAMPGDDLKPVFTDFIPSGNLATPVPVISNGFPVTCDMGNASTLYLDTYGLTGTAVFDTGASSWTPNSMAPRNVHVNHGMICDPALLPGPNLRLTQVPIPKWEDLLDPALFHEPRSDSLQHQLKGNCSQYIIPTPAQDTDIQPGNLLQHLSYNDVFTAPNFGDNEHLRLNLRSLPTEAMAVPLTMTDKFQFSGADGFSGSFNCPTSENVQWLEVSPMASPSALTWPSSCEAFQLDDHKISGRLGFTKFEVFQDLGATSAFDPSSSTGSEEQQRSYLDQEGSSSEWPIIIKEEQFDNSVPTMQEWDIYSATPPHALFPTGKEETSIFEPDLADLSTLDYTTGEHDAPDILQEVAALGEIPLSEYIFHPSAVGEDHEFEGGCSTNVLRYGVDM